MSLTHAFVSQVPDGSDVTKVRPSNWNAEHVFSGGAHQQLLMRDTGDATGASWQSVVTVDTTHAYALITGSLGIGTTSPSTKIHTKEAATVTGWTFENSSHGIARINFLTGAANWYIDHRGAVDGPNDRLAFSNDNSEVLSLLAGVPRVGLGVPNPTARLHLMAGSATASTAPLKFTSGTHLTTPEAGAMEYNGTNLFFTRTGTTREGVLTQSAVTTEALTSDTSVTVNINGTTYKLLARA
jgi:hypothetical protein